MPAHIVERAFHLAGTGAFANARELTAALHREGFTRYEIDAWLGGGSISRELGQARRDANELRLALAG